MPLEAVMSKYYGESERLLGAVFSKANELSDGAIIFLDEVKKRCFFYSLILILYQFVYDLQSSPFYSHFRSMPLLFLVIVRCMKQLVEFYLYYSGR